MVERYSRRQFLTSIGVVGSGVSLSGCSGGRTGDGGGGGSRTVDMTDGLAFEPPTLSIVVGDTVTWRTVGSVGHTVTAYDDEIPSDAAYFASGGFDSEDAARQDYPGGTVAADESYTHTFETPGTYAYFCVPHERSGMTGTIEVAEE